MDRQEAEAILQGQLDRYQSWSYQDLKAFIGQIESYQAYGELGVQYQIEIQVLWDDAPGRNIRVLGSIDDGGLRAFVPICLDFIVAPDGRFVGE
jgi:hypothetical protein